MSDDIFRVRSNELEATGSCCSGKNQPALPPKESFSEGADSRGRAEGLGGRGNNRKEKTSHQIESPHISMEAFTSFFEKMLLN
jgi:hypothetical protein